MGLKKSNYEVKTLGITLDTAYAVIHRIEIDGKNGTAEFYIQNSPRENAFNLKPLDRKLVHFTVNRDENPFTTAYNTAKTDKTVEELLPDGETKVVEIKGVFSGWEDDIQVI